MSILKSIFAKFARAKKEPPHYAASDSFLKSVPNLYEITGAHVRRFTETDDGKAGKHEHQHQ